MRKSVYNRTTDFYRAKTAKERLYYGAGIPSIAWEPFSEKIFFHLMMYNDNQILPEEQTQWYEKFKTTTEEFNKPYLIFIGGAENDHIPNLLAYELMKFALSKDYNVQITSADMCNEEEVQDETVFMLYNAFLECTNDRIQNIRDWIRRHEANFRIITLGGDPSIFVKRCRVKPNVLLYVNGVTIQTRV